MEKKRYFFWQVDYKDSHGGTTSHAYKVDDYNYRDCQNVAEAKEMALAEFARLWVESNGASDIRVFEACNMCMGHGEISVTTGKRVIRTKVKRCPMCRGKDSLIQHV